MSQVFQYKVRDPAGRLITGVLEAENKQLVIDKLRRNGYLITSIEEGSGRVSFQEQLAAWRKVKVKDLAIMARQFATMISSGLTVVKCLQVLVRQTASQKLQAALAEILQEVESGSSLSRALGKHSDIFPNLFVSMVRAGETGGVLDVVMDRLADYYEKEHELREKIKSATRYPMVISIFAALVVLFMLIAILPTFVQMFTSLNAALPMPTRILIGLSDFLREYFMVWIPLTGAFGYGLMKYIRTPEGKVQYEQVVMKLPVFGAMFNKISIARVCRTLGTLSSSGVPILQALESVSDVAGSTIIERGLLKARDSIREGEGISGPLAETGIFPVMVTQMIAIGEETGNIDEMLNKISDFYDKEIKNTVDSMTSLIEPFLIIFLAVVIGGIAISVLLPMFDLYGNISKI